MQVRVRLKIFVVSRACCPLTFKNLRHGNICCELRKLKKFNMEKNLQVIDLIDKDGIQQTNGVHFMFIGPCIVNQCQ
jgi:hypothetical protein